jgi:hypothetical protein
VESIVILAIGLSGSCVLGLIVFTGTGVAFVSQLNVTPSGESFTVEYALSEGEAVELY